MVGKGRERERQKQGPMRVWCSLAPPLSLVQSQKCPWVVKRGSRRKMKSRLVQRAGGHAMRKDGGREKDCERRRIEYKSGGGRALLLLVLLEPEQRGKTSSLGGVRHEGVLQQGVSNRPKRQQSLRRAREQRRLTSINSSAVARAPTSTERACERNSFISRLRRSGCLSVGVPLVAIR
jgi:hypothetical protein